VLIDSGRASFSKVGCALDHTPKLTTGLSSSDALNQKPVNLYSDLLVHNMGSGLADGITQSSGPPRSGDRPALLHDGRTSDLVHAIRAHASNGSEANAVIARYDALLPTDQQNILLFLRSL
jgi:CxxC motif-containing protein (DUF1111 family)